MTPLEKLLPLNLDASNDTAILAPTVFRPLYVPASRQMHPRRTREWSSRLLWMCLGLLLGVMLTVMFNTFFDEPRPLTPIQHAAPTPASSAVTAGPMPIERSVISPLPEAAESEATANIAEHAPEQAMPETPMKNIDAAPVPQTVAEHPMVTAATETSDSLVTPPASNLEISVHTLTPEDQAQEAYALGITLWLDGSIPDAEKKMSDALALSPTHVQAREALSQLLIQQGRWDDAEIILTEGISASPQHGYFVYALARLYVEQNQEARALNLLESLLATVEPDAEYLGLTALLCQRDGRYNEAIGAYYAALALHPAENRWWLGLGVSFETLQDYDAAREAYAHVTPATSANDVIANYAAHRLMALVGVDKEG